MVHNGLSKEGDLRRAPDAQRLERDVDTTHARLVMVLVVVLLGVLVLVVMAVVVLRLFPLPPFLGVPLVLFEALLTICGGTLIMDVALDLSPMLHSVV